MSSSRQPQQRRGSSRTQLACEPCRKRKSKCDGEKPVCGTCQSHSMSCHYEPARPTRRQKYWDRDYVTSLEEQVKLLSKSISQFPLDSASPESGLSPPQDTVVELPYGPRTLQALKDFSTVDWSSITQKNGETVHAGPGYISILRSSQLPTFEEEAGKPVNVNRDFIASVEHNIPLKQHLKAYFLAKINPYYNFVDPSWLDFSDLFPNNDTVLQLLYSGMFAAAAYVCPSTPREVADAFIAYAESLVQQCYLQHLCLPVLQSLLIIAWYNYMSLDLTKGNLYHYMAIGLSTHLKVKTKKDPVTDLNDVATARTFWCLVIMDRTSLPKLGMPTGIPWDLGVVRPYLDTLPPDMIDIPALAFDFNCRLFHLHEKHIEPIFAASFHQLTPSVKHGIVAKANGELLAFRKLIDKRLYLGRNVKPHKTQLLFWINYHSTILVMQRPLLNPEHTDLAAGIPVALRMATAAASAVTRLVKMLQAMDELRTAPHYMIFLVFRAALIHGINLVSCEETGTQRVPGNFWVCLRALGELSETWKDLGETFKPFVHTATHAWGLDIEKGPSAAAEADGSAAHDPYDLVGDALGGSPGEQDEFSMSFLS